MFGTIGEEVSDKMKLFKNDKLLLNNIIIFQGIARIWSGQYQNLIQKIAGFDQDNVILCFRQCHDLSHDNVKICSRQCQDLVMAISEISPDNASI